MHWRRALYLFTDLFNWRKHKYNLFTPSNKLTIRNVPRSWVEYDYRLLHASFTVMCEYVEKQCHGLVELNDRIAGRENDILENLQRLQDAVDDPEEQNRIRAENNCIQDCMDSEQILRDLYVWYTTTDWDNPVPESQSYKDAYSRISYVWEDCEDMKGYSELVIKGTPEDIALSDVERKLHTEKEREFRSLCNDSLLRLISIRETLWN